MHHGAQRHLLQMHELRRNQWMFVRWGTDTMSWGLEYTEARQSLLECADFVALRDCGHELKKTAPVPDLGQRPAVRDEFQVRALRRSILVREHGVVHGWNRTVALQL